MLSSGLVYAFWGFRKHFTCSIPHTNLRKVWEENGILQHAWTSRPSHHILATASEGTSTDAAGRRTSWSSRLATRFYLNLVFSHKMICHRLEKQLGVKCSFGSQFWKLGTPKAWCWQPERAFLSYCDVAEGTWRDKRVHTRGQLSSIFLFSQRYQCY